MAREAFAGTAYTDCVLDGLRWNKKVPQAYRRAIQAAEAVTLNFNLPQNVSVEIESAVVLSVADALGITSKQDAA